jgi:hypothetical protein
MLDPYEIEIPLAIRNHNAEMEVGLVVSMQNNPKSFFERTALTPEFFRRKAVEFFKFSREAAKLCTRAFDNRPPAQQQPSGH